GDRVWTGRRRTLATLQGGKMAISRNYTINGLGIAVSAQASAQDPAGVLSVTATASCTPPSQTTPITYSQTWVFDPAEPANQALSPAQMQVQCESYFQAIANHLATLIMLNNTFQQVT
ncbi:MAG: hypothetical protein ACRD3D_08795, partial [Terriglobia bacterium]